ncbi:MAG: DUF805 domain-containing protein [Deltaproteobacteria bacterium]|jgi:uncharacterized membrane protein YhaH (DUF805 family)|nr:DUF805 domain-containing protein [Deltaproteobacteria bacterium]
MNFLKVNFWNHIIDSYRGLGASCLDGRMGRRDFWMYMLVEAILFFVLVLTMIIPILNFFVLFIFMPFVFACLLVPNLILCAKRLHDVDMPAGLAFLPMLNLILSLQAGTPGPNRFGPPVESVSGGTYPTPAFPPQAAPGYLPQAAPQQAAPGYPPQSAPQQAAPGYPPQTVPQQAVSDSTPQAPPPQDFQGGLPSQDPGGELPRPEPSAVTAPGEQGTPNPGQEDDTRSSTVPLDKA